ncbi:MAG: RDD family protein [Pirellulaceae bacterium]
MNQTMDAKIDCRVRVVTPENIAFEYALAGPFQRLPAFALDLLVRVAFFIAVAIFLGIVGSFLPFGGGTIATVVIFLLFFFLSWFYGIFFETRFNGRTLGKMVFKLRVISTDGRPINAPQAALRNMLRLADMCIMLPLQIFSVEAPAAFVIPTFSFGLIAMVLTRRFQRVGDVVAKTMVISERTQSRPWRLKPNDVRAFGLAEMIPANFAASPSLTKTIGLYMENRKRLSPGRLDELASHITKPLIEKFGFLPDTGPDLLMTALYTRVFLPENERDDGLQQYRNLTRQSGTGPTMESSLATPISTATKPSELVGSGNMTSGSLGDLLTPQPQPVEELNTKPESANSPPDSNNDALPGSQA